MNAPHNPSLGKRLLRRLPFHRWKPMKWGTGLDARECKDCGRCEVWTFSHFTYAHGPLEGWRDA